MRVNSAYLNSHGAARFTAALTFVLLIPALVFGQQDAEVARLRKENQQLEAQVKVLQAQVVEAQLEARRLKEAAVAQKVQSDVLRERLEQLLAQIRKENAAKAANDAKADDANPPAEQVKGKIEKVDGDLVQINLGTDAGVNKNHTLEVYRVTPDAKYLGRIRIVDATKNQSVGRLVPAGNATTRSLMVGDLVVSKLPTKLESKK